MIVMKKKNIELDVDFIGGQEPLTKEEEQVISSFIAARKAQVLKKKSGGNKRMTNPRRKELA